MPGWRPKGLCQPPRETGVCVGQSASGKDSDETGGSRVKIPSMTGPAPCILLMLIIGTATAGDTEERSPCLGDCVTERPYRSYVVLFPGSAQQGIPIVACEGIDPPPLLPM
jgi:hypothetical protein